VLKKVWIKYQEKKLKLKEQVAINNNQIV